MKTHSPLETRALAEKVAAFLQKGDVLLFYGDLGAGKSEFIRGLAAGLDIAGPVSSPSFTIMNLYDDGRLPLYHFDWYRLESSDELFEMGLDEYLGGDGIAAVEWPTRCPDAIPESYLAVEITPVDDNTREIKLIPHGGFHSIPMEELSE